MPTHLCRTVASWGQDSFPVCFIELSNMDSLGLNMIRFTDSVHPLVPTFQPPGGSLAREHQGEGGAILGQWRSGARPADDGPWGFDPSRWLIHHSYRAISTSAMGRMGEPWVNQPCGFWEVISGSGGRRPRDLAAQEVPRAGWPCSPSNSTSCTARAACPKVAHGRARGSEEVGPRNLQLGHQICLWINTAKFKSIYSKYDFQRDEHKICQLFGCSYRSWFTTILDPRLGRKKVLWKGCQGQAQLRWSLKISNTWPSAGCHLAQVACYRKRPRAESWMKLWSSWGKRKRRWCRQLLRQVLCVVMVGMGLGPPTVGGGWM